MYHVRHDQWVLRSVRLGLERVPGGFPENRRARGVGHPADPHCSWGLLDYAHCGAGHWHLSGCARTPTAFCSPLPSPSMGSFLTC